MPIRELRNYKCICVAELRWLMNYPLISEYISSIMCAEDNFATLTNLRPVLDDEGRPIMSSGNFAVVFKMEDVETEKVYAVKCFTKDQEGRSDAYRLIAKELKDIASSHLASFEYKEEELFVVSSMTQNEQFPVVVMEWIDGQTLDCYIKQYSGNHDKLRLLSYHFCQMAIWLFSQPFAHGDLKNDNIIVQENGNVVLLDYDGMYIPDMAGQKSREIGSPNFRHPARNINDFNKGIDDLALTSIALALRAMSINPFLINKYKVEDSVLFRSSDFSDIANSKLHNDILHLLYDPVLTRLYTSFHLALSNILERDIAIRSMSFSKNELDKYSMMYLNAKVLYDKTDSTEEEKVQSYQLFKESAEHGNTDAQGRLGACYVIGHGVEKDYAKAIRWIVKSAEQGNAMAQWNLGKCYYSGDGVEKDYNKAVEWFRKSAEQGQARAQNYLGSCYYSGNGVEKDFNKAVEWYRKSAEQGNAIAQNYLGVCYAKGYGVEKDYNKAVKWLTKSAEQGNAHAQNNLGICYENGNGVEKDLIEAAKWYKKSAEQGNARAKELLNALHTMQI